MHSHTLKQKSKQKENNKSKQFSGTFTTLAVLSTLCVPSATTVPVVPTQIQTVLAPKTCTKPCTGVTLEP